MNINILLNEIGLDQKTFIELTNDISLGQFQVLDNPQTINVLGMQDYKD